jgi:hypothetical protein
MSKVAVPCTEGDVDYKVADKIHLENGDFLRGIACVWEPSIPNLDEVGSIR